MSCSTWLGLSVTPHFSHRMCSTANNHRQLLFRNLEAKSESSDDTFSINVSPLSLVSDILPLIYCLENCDRTNVSRYCFFLVGVEGISWLLLVRVEITYLWSVCVALHNMLVVRLPFSPLVTNTSRKSS